jgi:hypothetical protein
VLGPLAISLMVGLGGSREVVDRSAGAAILSIAATAGW